MADPLFDAIAREIAEAEAELVQFTATLNRNAEDARVMLELVDELPPSMRCEMYRSARTALAASRELEAWLVRIEPLLNPRTVAVFRRASTAHDAAAFALMIFLADDDPPATCPEGIPPCRIP